MRLVAYTLFAGLFVVAAHAALAAPTLDAQLVDDEVQAKKSSAVIQVTVTEIDLVDPDDVGGEPRPGQGHLHYRIDGGPIIATPTRKLAFHELAPGPHNVVVTLVGNDHQPIGPQETVQILIPSAVVAY